jgi:hypothetical protein
VRLQTPSACLDEWHALLTGAVDEPEPFDVGTIRKEADAVGIKAQPPVKVATFDC